LRASERLGRGARGARNGRNAVVRDVAEPAPAFAEEQAWPHTTIRAGTCEPDHQECASVTAGALQANRKIFPLLVDGSLVLKLPRARVEERVGAGDGAPFDPGHGRVMREWVAVSPSAPARWIELAEEARAFVSSR
jgi:hypothetical protein